MIRGFNKNNGQAGNKSNSRLKPGSKGQKKKMVLAKDRNQAILAIAIVAIFITKSAYDLTSYLYKQHVEQEQIKKASMQFANNQQKNLESLAQDPASGDVAPVAPTAPPGNIEADANDIYSQTLSIQGKTPEGVPPQVAPPNSPGPNNSRVQIPVDDSIAVTSKKRSVSKNYKMALIQVSDSGRSNPFLPAAENDGPVLPKLNLIAPPDPSAINADAKNILGTTISGILYDKYSPSAIINIDGTDYLVKKGDLINKYKIIAITKDQVTVKLGSNIYKAGAGQLLEESKINYNTISNLEKKFGGNEVYIGVKKKKY